MPAWLVPAAIAAGQLITGLIGQHKQNKYEKGLARYQADMNQKYLDAQNAYNTPKAQMSRFQDAGLNPNLIYGQGSPGNQSESLKYPQQRSVDQGAALSAIGPNFMNAMMTQSQVQAIDAKTRDTYVVTRLHQLQNQVLARNPSLQDSGFEAIMSSLISSAEIKASESKIKGQEARLLTTQDMKTGLQYGEQMFLRQMDFLEQKFNLSNQDAKVKAEIISGKEFQNELLRIQSEWMRDAKITPQHIYTFIQMLLMKLLN